MEGEQEKAPAQKDPAPKERELTFGENAVGLSFNPSNDPKVQEIKESFAKVIDICNDMRAATAVSADVARMIAIAITEAQTAQMWAVKAATWKK